MTQKEFFDSIDPKATNPGGSLLVYTLLFVD
jgi:hypothetical protein